MRSLILIAHNLRSTHNVGSLLRTADGLGVDRVVLSGYTPYPHHQDDARLPHMYKKIDAQIHKTALGAETNVSWQYAPDIAPMIQELRDRGYRIIALEQSKTATPMTGFSVPDKLAVIVGREVEGIETEVLDLCDEMVEIPMAGQKESFNVTVAAAIFLSYCRFC